jgi:hypothetical protein
MKYAGGTFSGFKSVLCTPEITVLGHHYTPEGHLPDLKQITVISNWGACNDISDIRSFLGTIVVYCPLIQNFAHRAHHLSKLVRNNHPFEWGPQQEAAQQDLKMTLLTSPALQPIDYDSSAPVILSIDTSYIVIGYILSQCNLNNPKL